MYLLLLITGLITFCIDYNNYNLNKEYNKIAIAIKASDKKELLNSIIKTLAYLLILCSSLL